MEKKGINMINVLIVDDQPYLRELFCDELADAGFNDAKTKDSRRFSLKEFS